jgi:hypothetical protein
MFTRKNGILSMILAATSMSVVEETGGGASAAPAPEAKVARPVLEIIRGRMPIAIVFLVRFGDNKAKTVAEKAKLFGTTVGKVDDIVKNRNFAYIKDDFKPTQEQVDSGIAWLKTHPRYDAENVDSLIAELEKTPIATAEEAAALEAVRVSLRAPRETTKDGAKADAGGGNKRGKKATPETGEATQATATSAEDLLV